MLGASATRETGVSRPLVAALIVSAWVMVLFCRLQLTSRLTWAGLVGTAVGCFALTALFHALTVMVVRGIVGLDEPLPRVLLRTWVPVVWVPCLIVLTMDGSLWVALLVPALTVLVAWAVLRGRVPAAQERGEGTLQSLFHVPAELAVRETVMPAVMLAALVELALLAEVRRWDWAAGLLLAVGAVMLVRRGRVRARRAEVSAALATALAALCTLVALVPFMKPGQGALALALLAMQSSGGAPSTSVRAAPRPALGDTGIVLTLPPKKRAETLPPVPSASASAAVAKDRLIPFDGQYWYFREFEERPSPDARKVQGNPLKAEIQSTNRLSLMMEAHQTFVPSLELDCCGTLELHTTNADEREDPIFVEVLLGDGVGKPVSLGVKLLPSSSVEGRKMARPASEVVSYALTPAARRLGISQMTVRIRKYGGGAGVASQVAVVGFEVRP